MIRYYSKHTISVSVLMICLFLCTLAIAINTKCKVKIRNVLIPYTDQGKLLGEARTPCVFHLVLRSFLIFFCSGFRLCFQQLCTTSLLLQGLQHWWSVTHTRTLPFPASHPQTPYLHTREDGWVYRCCRGLCCSSLPECFWQLL